LSVDEVENGGLAKLGEPLPTRKHASILERAQRDSVIVTEKASPPR
jgi:xanthine dehydrogenase YagR molybdenum-binding subunit